MLSIPCRCTPCPHVSCPSQTKPTLGLGAGYFNDCTCMPCYNKFAQEEARKCAANRQEDDASRNKRLLPIFTDLELDRRAKIRYSLENKADLRKIEGMAKFRTATQMEERSMDLERRSDRLKRIMDDEMFNYSQEVINNFEQKKDSRLEMMRQRVAELRNKREAEDKQIVATKLEESFQKSCEQLRTLRVQKMAKDITKDWDEQIRMKQRLECEEEENDRMYAYLWMKDAENKYKLEQAAQCARAEALKKGLRELDQQMEYKKKLDSLQYIVREKELAENNKINQEIEDEKRRVKEEKHARYLRSKQHVADMMATKEYYKTRRIKREEIVALEFLKKAVRELYIEEADRNKAKRELMRSIEIYREYLKQRDCLANSRDMELQQIIDNVIEEQYQKVNESRRREQAQRRKLFCTVMKGRAQQVEDLKKQREEEAAQYKGSVEQLKQDWKDYLREVEAEKEKKLQKKMEYRNELDCQIQYKNIRQQRDLAEFHREAELCEMQDLFFTDKLRRTVSEVKDVQANPFRHGMVGKHIKQCLRPV